MGILPRPRQRCTLHDERAETLDQLKIIHVTAIDGDYYDRTNTQNYWKCMKEENKYVS